MWNESPVHVQCMRQGVRGWCTGMTQRDGMGKEVGGGFRMGNRCTPVVYSCQCMAKPLQYCKVIIFQLKKKERKRTFKSVFEPTNKDISDTTVYFYNQFYSILQLKVFVCFLYTFDWVSMANHSTIPAWRTPWREWPGGPQPMGSQRITTEWLTLLFLHFHNPVEPLKWSLCFKTFIGCFSWDM